MLHAHAYELNNSEILHWYEDSLFYIIYIYFVGDDLSDYSAVNIYNPLLLDQ